MKINYLDLDIDQAVKDEMLRLLESLDNNKDDLENIWQLMDGVWDKLGCNNKKLDWSNINKFYSHPVWLLNGFFIEQDPLSIQHRHAISDWIADNPSIRKILDYGGGFGTLARLIADKKPSLLVDIYEPHPSDYSKQKISNYPQIQFISNIKNKYDVLVSTDVLEHVPDPLKTFEKMILSVKDDGYLIIANNFFPVIKCHLPSNFHLRYTFDIFTRFLGLRKIGICQGSHATIYMKIPEKITDSRVLKIMESISQKIFPFMELVYPVYKHLKGALI
jgi:2-polyprenyl-6-hydroxyphenyl methylase/3-demethylubiquinone-9 3-methyltransferase